VGLVRTWVTIPTRGWLVGGLGAGGQLPLDHCVHHFPPCLCLCGKLLRSSTDWTKYAAERSWVEAPHKVKGKGNAVQAVVREQQLQNQAKDAGLTVEPLEGQSVFSAVGPAGHEEFGWCSLRNGCWWGLCPIISHVGQQAEAKSRNLPE